MSVNYTFLNISLLPSQKKTLPSLELLAVYLALQCILNIIDNINFCIRIDHIQLLTDSQVALSWLITNKVMKKNIFVHNRLKEITSFKERLVKKDICVSYSYIPSEHNVADLVTKTVSASKFCKYFKTWANGPPWILKCKENWPTGQLGCIPASVKVDIEEESCPIVMAVSKDSKASILDMERFSTYTKLLNVTIKVFSAVNKFQGKPVLLPEVKSHSFYYLMKCMQLECFEEEIRALGRLHHNYDSVPKLVKNLNLFIDSKGILRSKGRISKSLSVSYDSVNPILVGSSHPLAKLLIKDAHYSCKHLGVDSTLNMLRHLGFWVLNARHAVKNVLNECILCKKYNARAFTVPPTPSLPRERVNLERPFYHTGVDYTGFFFVQDLSNIKVKSYILIFTCMNTRAIHLELVFSLSVENFIMAFVWFYNRYGLPRFLYSDNAKTFTAGASVLSNLIASDYFQQKFIKYNFTHKPIPTYSPWMGACWERLIKTVKQCLYKSIGRNTLSYVNFITLLSDIQLAINNRPLTYRDKDNQLEIVTPNSLISTYSSFPSLIISEENLICSPDENYQEKLAGSLEHRDALINKFRLEWFNNYLLSLRGKHRDSFYLKELHSHKNSYLYVGSVVLVKHPTRSRSYWSLGRIVELTAGDDGLVRIVKVRKPDYSVVVTSISNLYLLELDSGECPGDGNHNISDDSTVDLGGIFLLIIAKRVIMKKKNGLSNCPKSSRKAALKLRQNLEQWLEDNSI